MADTVDHDDLAEQVAGAPKEVQELTPAELREKMSGWLSDLAAILSDARGCMMIGATNGAKERLNAAIEGTLRARRELRS